MRRVLGLVTLALACGGTSTGSNSDDTTFPTTMGETSASTGVDAIDIPSLDGVTVVSGADIPSLDSPSLVSPISVPSVTAVSGNSGTLTPSVTNVTIPTVTSPAYSAPDVSYPATGVSDTSGNTTGPGVQNPVLTATTVPSDPSSPIAPSLDNASLSNVSLDGFDDPSLDQVDGFQDPSLDGVTLDGFDLPTDPSVSDVTLTDVTSVTTDPSQTTTGETTGDTTGDTAPLAPAAPNGGLTGEDGAQAWVRSLQRKIVFPEQRPPAAIPSVLGGGVGNAPR